jgi:hypothetical protein
MLSFSKQAQRLQAAQAELYDLLVQNTDLHPKVQAKRQQIAEIQHDLASAPTNAEPVAWLPPSHLPASPDIINPEADILHIKLRTLEDGRQDLVKRQREAEFVRVQSPGSVRVFGPGHPLHYQDKPSPNENSARHYRRRRPGFWQHLAPHLLAEFLDTRLKTADDVSRVTRLPILTGLGDLQEMEEAERAQWAFRTWTMLQGRLSPSANFGLVCGITSSAPGEGRSTWVKLLAEAASMTGFRVLTIATRPSPTHVSDARKLLRSPRKSRCREGPATSAGGKALTPGSKALTTSVLASPAQVTEKLTGPNSQPVVHIPSLVGYGTWNVESNGARLSANGAKLITS